MHDRFVCSYSEVCIIYCKFLKLLLAFIFKSLVPYDATTKQHALLHIICFSFTTKKHALIITAKILKAVASIPRFTTIKIKIDVGKRN